MAPEIPHLDKIIGGSLETQEALEERAAELFKKGGKWIDGFEIKKTPRDTEIINSVQKAVSDYQKQYGRQKDINYELSNIHLFSEGGVEKFTDGEFRSGAHGTKLASVLVDRHKLDGEFAIRLFHELWHGKAFQALRLDKDGDLLVRGGFMVEIKTLDGKKHLFSALEEAIAGLMTERFYREKLKDLLDDAQLDSVEPSRQKEQIALQELIEELSSLSGINRGEIENLFIRSQVTGNITELTKLIEKTFGRGSMKKISQI